MNASRIRSALVTGGAGFIGSNLCRVLLLRGYMVHAVDNLITGHRRNIRPFLTNPSFTFSQLDIIKSAFRRKFLRISLTEVYHLACPTGVPNIRALPEEMLHTQSIGTLNVLEVARTHGAKVLFTSSAEVYGQPEVSPQCEHYSGNVDPVGPRSPYEEGKRFSETLFVMYAIHMLNMERRVVKQEKPHTILKEYVGLILFAVPWWGR